MPKTDNRIIYTFAVPPQLHKKFQWFIANLNLDQSDALRIAVAEWCGDASLAEMRRPGNPEFGKREK